MVRSGERRGRWEEVGEGEKKREGRKGGVRLRCVGRERWAERTRGGKEKRAHQGKGKGRNLAGWLDDVVR